MFARAGEPRGTGKHEACEANAEDTAQSFRMNSSSELVVPIEVAEARQDGQGAVGTVFTMLDVAFSAPGPGRPLTSFSINWSYSASVATSPAALTWTIL